MEPLGNTSPLPAAFSAAQLSADATIVGLLATELPAAMEVDMLDPGYVRESDLDRVCRRR